MPPASALLTPRARGSAAVMPVKSENLLRALQTERRVAFSRTRPVTSARALRWHARGWRFPDRPAGAFARHVVRVRAHLRGPRDGGPTGTRPAVRLPRHPSPRLSLTPLPPPSAARPSPHPRRVRLEAGARRRPPRRASPGRETPRRGRLPALRLRQRAPTFGRAPDGGRRLRRRRERGGRRRTPRGERRRERLRGAHSRDAERMRGR